MATFADNSIAKTANYIAKEAGVGFYNKAVLLPNVDTQYSSEYGTKAGGAKVGNTIRVRFPAQFITTSSVALSASTVQAIEEDTKILTLSDRVGVHADVSTEQATLELEQGGSEYSKRVLQPMGAALVAKMESLGFQKAALEAQNTIVMETPFADADVLRKNFVKARALLDKQLAPEGTKYTALGSDAELEVANSVLPLFHSQVEIEKAYKEGKMNVYGGLTWLCSNLVHTRVNGAGGEGGTVGAYTEGATTITLTAAVSGDLDALAVGDKIEIAAKLVNPESKVAYGNNIQRAVKAVSGSGATVTVTIDPIYTAESGAKQNTDGATSAAAIVGAAVTVLGTAGESYLVCPVWAKEAITMGNADLYMPKNVEMSSKNKVHNVAQRFIRFYDGNADSLLSRYESLITWDLLRPEWVTAVELKIS